MKTLKLSREDKGGLALAVVGALLGFIGCAWIHPGAGLAFAGVLGLVVGVYTLGGDA